MVPTGSASQAGESQQRGRETENDEVEEKDRSRDRTLSRRVRCAAIKRDKGRRGEAQSPVGGREGGGCGSECVVLAPCVSLFLHWCFTNKESVYVLFVCAKGVELGGVASLVFF